MKPIWMSQMRTRSFAALVLLPLMGACLGLGSFGEAAASVPENPPPRPSYGVTDSGSPTATRLTATEGTKSPGRAFLYSFGGTAVPVGIGLGTALGNNELSPGACAAIGGAIFGPSVGHFYAGRHKRAILGIVARGLGGAMVWGASVTHDGRRIAATTKEEVLLTGGLLLGTVSIVADIVTASHSARVHNEAVAEQVRLGAAPWVGPVAGAPGVGVRLAF